MDSVIHADIFFFIATIALALIAAGICIIAYYAIRIVRDVKDITETVKTESKHLAGDLEDMRAKAKKGFALASIIGLFKRAKKRRRGKDLSD